MRGALEILTVVLTALAAALSLAHALELPGKMRLSRDAYVAVQRIYYPGFTIGGGIGEPGSTIATLTLLFLTPAGTAEFWLTLGALLGLIGMQAVYWRVTHPVNKVWVEGRSLGAGSSAFFSFAAGSRGEREMPDWTRLRDRWELSHVARAVLSGTSFVLLVIAVS
jgi:hypothetical protein